LFVIDKRNDSHKKNEKTVRDRTRDTAADITKAVTDADDDDEEGMSEEGKFEHEDVGLWMWRGKGVKEHNYKNVDRHAP
jgi:hypothetical protein